MFIAKKHVSVFRMSLQLQVDDYFSSTSIKQLGVGCFDYFFQQFSKF